MAAPEKIEAILSHPLTHLILRLLTKKMGGRSILGDILYWYGREGIPLSRRLLYLLPFYLIDLIRRRAGASREAVRARLDHTPTFRALINTARSIGRFGLTKPQKFIFPLSVVWNFTQACNLRCVHCYQDAARPLPDELTLEEQYRVVDELIANDAVLLAFAGGEPLMSKNFWPVAERASRGGLHITVATNGTLLSKDVVRRMREVGVGYVEVSLDSIYPEKHNGFRGKDSWERTVKGIENAVAQSGLQVGIASCITRMNFEELEGLINFAREVGANKFYAFNFIPTGRGKDVINLDLTPQMREEMLEILTRHLNEGRIQIFSIAPQFGRSCLSLYGTGGLITTGHYGAGSGKGAEIFAKYIGGCGTSRCYLAIQPDGKVTPCVFIPIVVGNIRERSLVEIWNTSPVLEALRTRDDNWGHCGTCDYRYNCGGCRARAYGYFNDIKGPDPGCIYNQDYWEGLTSTCQ